MFVGCNKSENTKPVQSEATSEEKPVSKKPNFNGALKFTYMAKCQMRCGHYKSSVIRDALKKGKVVTRDRWLKKKPCPFYAVNYTHTNGDPMVIILAVCNEAKPVTKVVRVFNKNMKECDCKTKRVPTTS